MNLTSIIESMGRDKWEINLPISLKKSEIIIAEVATEAMASSRSEDNDSWFSWGASVLKAGSHAVSIVTELLDETDAMVEKILDITPYVQNEKKSDSEIIKDKILGMINEMQKLQKDPLRSYDCDAICKVIIENLEEYKLALKAEFNVTDQLGTLDKQIEDFRGLSLKLEIEANEKAAREAHENSLGVWLTNCMHEISDGAKEISGNAIEQFQSLAKVLNSDEFEFLENLKSQIAALLPSENNGKLFSEDEEKIILGIKEKLTNKEKLSYEEIHNLLKFTDRQKNLEDGIAEILKDSLLYKHAYITKNFVSLVGASLAGMVAGPVAAFAAHQAIGSIWQNYVSDASPKNRGEQLATVLMNGVIGAATGGVSGAIANTTAVVIEDEAPESIRDAIAAASIGYLAHVTGASAAVSLQVGLIGLLVIKGSQLFNVIKNDGKELIEAIKNPTTLPAGAFWAISKLANDTISAVWERNWSEVGSLASVGVISFSLLALGSIGTGVVILLPGIYLVNRFFHSDNTYKGGASLTNDDFCKWTAHQYQLLDNCDDQIKELKTILSYEMDEENYKKTANSIDKIISNSHVIPADSM